MTLELRPNEINVINTLYRLKKRWPATLWLFAADGSLHVMRCTKGGKHATVNNGAMDQSKIVATIRIDTDGGDW